MKSPTLAVLAAILLLVTPSAQAGGIGDNMPFVRAFKEELTPKWEGEQGSVNFLEDSTFDRFHENQGSNGTSADTATRSCARVVDGAGAHFTLPNHPRIPSMAVLSFYSLLQASWPCSTRPGAATARR